MTATTYTRREMHLGKRLAIQRQRLHLSADDIAARYGLPLDLLPSLEQGGEIPISVAPKIRHALADLGESVPGPVIVDASSRLAPPAAEATVTVEIPPASTKAKRVAPTLSDADRELLQQLKPARVARNLSIAEAARQLGMMWGHYVRLESIDAKLLRQETRDKIRAWLGDSSAVRGGTDESAAADQGLTQLAADEALRQAAQAIEDAFATTPDGYDGIPDDVLSDDEPDDDDSDQADVATPAAGPTVRAYAFTIPMPAPPPPRLDDLLRRLPAFSNGWPESVQLHWLDSFDHLATLIATEALP